MVACICHSPLHHQKPDFEGQSVIKASSYLLLCVLEAHRESLPRSCETSARRLSAESAEVYSTADLPASAAHIPFSVRARFNLSMEMSRLTRDETAEPVSRDQILRHARGQGNIHFPCSADHEQDWQPYPVDPYSAICDDHTYMHTYIHIAICWFLIFACIFTSVEYIIFTSDECIFTSLSNFLTELKKTEKKNTSPKLCIVLCYLPYFYLITIGKS